MLELLIQSTYIQKIIFEKDELFSKIFNDYTKVVWLVLDMYKRYLKKSTSSIKIFLKRTYYFLKFLMIIKKLLVLNLYNKYLKENSTSPIKIMFNMFFHRIKINQLSSP